MNRRAEGQWLEADEELTCAGEKPLSIVSSGLWPDLYSRFIHFRVGEITDFPYTETDDGNWKHT